MKSKSESEATALKAKAQADAAAMQAKATQDANTAQEAAAARAARDAATAKAAQDAAAAKAAQDAVAAKAAANAESSRYDGKWVMTQECGANKFSAGFTSRADFVVRGGEFVIERGASGQAGYNIARGRPAADGTLVMTGNGLGSQGGGRGQPFDILFAGRWTGDRFVLRGTWGGRDCKAEIARA
jgi:hypothetical protein